jgi:eukaryotic-like serine/threonine-protein kinase
VSAGYEMSLLAPSQKVREFNELFPDRVFATHSGCGVVYVAEQDQPVRRRVALKVIKLGMDTKQVVARFEAERQALAMMDHPSIAKVLDAGATDTGRPYFVMELVRGVRITDYCDQNHLSTAERLKLFVQVCHAVHHAHQKGVIHRDIKPSNILVMIADDVPVPKMIDFGIAKAIGEPLTDKTVYTRFEQFIGTPAYMSPEQAGLSGLDVDTRSDIYALGVLLYELLTGRTPLESQALAQAGLEEIRRIIREEEPPKPSTRLSRLEQQEQTTTAQRRATEAPKLIRSLRGDLDWIVMKCLEKNRTRRYETANELARDIEHHLNYQPVVARRPSKLYRFQKLVRRNKTVFAAVAAVLAALGVVGLLAVWFLHHQARSRWAREQLLPKIEQLIEGGWGNYMEAYKIATEAKKYIPRDPRLSESLLKITFSISIKTEPPGAKIYMKEYKAPENEWEYLGGSPIKNIRLPIGFFRWKMEKEGYETVFAAAPTFELDLRERRLVVPNDITRILDRKGTVPPGMVRVLGQGEIGNFYIDKDEVTSKQFKEFMDQGGYEKKEYWKHKFVKDGKEMTWEDAVRQFVDATGRPGPATWKAGQIPEGQENHPVSGVSWYEAAAYAEFRGKSLPTAIHWGIASSGMSDLLLPRGFNTFLAKMSNFDGKGPAPVGSHPGMTAYGAYDMSGNVREWCWNEAPQGKVIRGGAWNDYVYMFLNLSQASPLNRSPKNGFRCVLYIDFDKIPKSAFEAKKLRQAPDFLKEEPVSDSIFKIYKEQFSYDKTDLAARVEWKNEDSRDWTEEKISFSAAYENERIIAYLFLPKTGAGPYQTLIFFPGSGSVSQRSSKDLGHYWEFERYLGPIVKGGRAVLYPVYKGTFERGRDDLTEIHAGADTHQYTELFIKVVKDFSRCIDYLETRRDIDRHRLAYFGLSWGARYGAIIPAVDERLGASVLVVGGFGPRSGRSTTWAGSRYPP